VTAETNHPDEGGATTRDLLDIPAVADMAALDRRFCLWRQEVRDGKPTKVPLRSTGAKARNNDPSTWCTYERALTALKELRAEGTRIDGIGVFLGRLEDGRFLVGLDLDLCRSPTTKVIEPWAQEWIDRLRTYTEVSPSETGVKLFGKVEWLPPPLVGEQGP